MRPSDTPIFDMNNGNPYSARPPSARDADDIEVQVGLAMTELDKVTNAPEGVERPLWERFCRYRRSKYGSELMVINFIIITCKKKFLSNKFNKILYSLSLLNLKKKRSRKNPKF